VERSGTGRLAVFTVAFALLVNEIMVSAIFNVVIGAQNALVAIAVAMLGLAASGIVAYVAPAFAAARLTEGRIVALLAATALATLACTVVIMALPVNHGDFSYAPSVAANAWKLVAYIAAVVPFFVGGLAIACAFTKWPERIGTLYFWDLAGAALGCMAAVALMAPLGAPRAIVWASLPAAALAVAWLLRRGRVAAAALVAVPYLLLEAAVGAGVPLYAVKSFNTLGEVDNPSYRSFRATPQDLEFEQWALDAWTIVRRESIPQQWERFRGWGLSKRYDGPVPRMRLVNYNLRFSTYVTEFDGDIGKLSAYLDADLIALHYAIGRTYPRVLNIGAGGGREVLNALNHGSTDVTAVDISRATIDELMKGDLAQFSGRLYERPGVTAVADEGRSFVRRSGRTYDLLDFTIVGGTNIEKLDVMKVEDLFTVEALESYLAHLAPDGVFSYVMYNTSADLVAAAAKQPFVASLPYIPALKTLTGLRTVLERMRPGTNFADHVLIAGLPGVMAKGYDLVHIFVSRSPFTAEERARFERRVAELAFVPLFPAAGGANLYDAIVRAPDLAALERTLPFNIRPATDDRPFHYAFAWHAVPSAAAFAALLWNNPVTSTGLVFAAIALLFLAGPLAVWRRREPAAAHTVSIAPLLAYFACIGAGYMMIEMAVLLKLQLYLGKPTYSLSVGLFSFLLASGVGSALTNRFRHAPPARVAAWAVAAILAYGAAFTALWPVVFERTIELPDAGRIATAVLVIAPLALPMGFLFPLGMRLATSASGSLVPWLWAVNGCLSIVGIFGGRIVGLFAGFRATLVAGLVLYALTAACAWLYARRRRAAV